MGQKLLKIALYLTPKAQQEAEAGAAGKLEKLQRTTAKIRMLIDVLSADPEFEELSVGSRIVALTVSGSLGIRKKVDTLLQKYPELTDTNPYAHRNNGVMPTKEISI